MRATTYYLTNKIAFIYLIEKIRQTMIFFSLNEKALDVYEIKEDDSQKMLISHDEEYPYNGMLMYLLEYSRGLPIRLDLIFSFIQPPNFDNEQFALVLASHLDINLLFINDDDSGILYKTNGETHIVQCHFEFDETKEIEYVFIETPDDNIHNLT